MGHWLPLVVPTVTTAVVALVSLFFVYRLEGRDRRFLRHAFGHYVSPEIINEIVQTPDKLTLGGERRELTILFSDIAGFTSISERMEPTKLGVFLNLFLSEMTDIILASGGTIDKYEGDAIIAFWNAPVDVVDHQAKGVLAALRCQERLAELGDRFTREFDAQVIMRVGLHSGAVVVGNFGSKTRFNYTMIGDAANLAARLEGVNKVFGTRILVSEATQQAARQFTLQAEQGRFSWRYVGRIRVVGRKEPVPVYEPVSRTLQPATFEHLALYEQALTAFEGGEINQSFEIFTRLQELDPVAASYLRRIKQLMAEGVGGAGYDPVWSLDSK